MDSSIRKYLALVGLIAWFSHCQGYEVLHGQLASDLIHAEKLYSEAAFIEAAEIYANAVQQLSGNSRTEVRIKLANALFQAEEYSKLIHYFLHATNEEEILYTAAAYQKLGQHANAMTLAAKLSSKLFNEEGASLLQWTRANALIGLEDKPAAKMLLLSLADETPLPQYRFLANLQLARLAIAEGNALAAEKYLGESEKAAASSMAMQNELYYWQGKQAFLAKQYQKAAEYFSQTNPRIPQHAFDLALSYIKWAETAEKEPEKQLMLYAKAEKTLAPFLEGKEQSQAELILSELLINRSRLEEETDGKAKALQLLNRLQAASDAELRIKALQLSLKIPQVSGEKERVISLLADEYADLGNDSILGNYYKAASLLEEGLHPDMQQDPQAAKYALSKATNLLRNIHRLESPPSSQVNTASIRLLAYASQKLEDEDALLDSFSIMGDFLTRFAEASGREELSEIWYLHGLTAYLLMAEFPEMRDQAQTSWRQAAALNSTWSPEAAFALGALAFENKQYEEAERLFSFLAETYSTQPVAGTALYFAAIAQGKLGKNTEIAQSLKRKVFENYPDSPYAAEAYINLYPLVEYLHGGQKEYKHLQAMPQKFPNSPWSILAYYLIGLDNKKERVTPEGKLVHKQRLLSAIDSFHNAETLFLQLNDTASIPLYLATYFQHLYQRAILEKGLVNMDIADTSSETKKKIYLDYAAELFNKLHGILSKEEAQSGSAALTSLHEENLYALVRTYQKMDRRQEAEAVLNSMLLHYKQANTTRGYYLSRAWFEKGELAASREEYAAALEYYGFAEEAAKGKVLTSDQKIDLWIKTSAVLRSLKKLDQAMLYLSKAINEDAVSHLRLKAMYLRGEIYEEQGRYELAVKQWDSLAKKGGEWGQKAKERL